MDASRRAPGYDLFKLIVAILLLILFLLLLRRPTFRPLSPAPTAAPPTVPSTPSVTRDVNPVAVPGTATSPSETSTVVPLPSYTDTPAPAPTDSVPSPTAIDPEPPTATPSPFPTTTNAGTPTVTPLPTPTPTPVSASTTTPGPETPALQTACEAATARSRLQPGTQATILRRLNFRSSPGIRDNWLRTNLPGTSVEVVGGPECLPHISGAYVWWQIKLPDGTIGWSAEGSIHGTFYFMEP